MLRDIEGTTRVFISKRIKTDLKGSALEPFVGALFRAMGYNARATRAVRDDGVDVIAHRDELGIEPPIIKIQVKSHDANICADHVKAFYAVVQERDVGIFITTGDYTASASSFARSKGNLKLIGGPGCYVEPTVILAKSSKDSLMTEETFGPHIRSKEQYAQLLNAFYGYIYPVQEKIAQFIDRTIVTDMDQRRNASLITDDIHSLGLPLNNTLSTDIPDIFDHPSALGALYVLEGSTLGGKIIAKTIADKLGSTDALSFFKGYGSETGPMWKKFTQYLDRPLNPQAAEAVVHTATQTFRCFGTWFEKQLI